MLEGHTSQQQRVGWASTVLLSLYIAWYVSPCALNIEPITKPVQGILPLNTALLKKGHYPKLNLQTLSKQQRNGSMNVCQIMIVPLIFRSESRKTCIHHD
jgi:hypothetical protein